MNRQEALKEMEQAERVRNKANAILDLCQDLSAQEYLMALSVVTGRVLKCCYVVEGHDAVLDQMRLYVERVIELDDDGIPVKKH
jgi:hypothetical protein